MPVIKRYLSKENCRRAKTELAFLIRHLSSPRFRGDLAIEFRGPSVLSVYDRGFRLAQVRFGRDGLYRVTTHVKFVCSTPLDPAGEGSRFVGSTDSAQNYVTFTVSPDEIHALLQSNYIARMRSRIKEISHKEEIGVAHFIAADTMNERTDVVVIDREVGDSAPDHRGERLDLLALQQVELGKYRFLAIEVKLGNNPELNTVAQKRAGARSAVGQVEGYRDQIETYFDDYAACYARNIAQKLELGLLNNSWSEAPTIVRGAQAMLVVAGYGGIAKRNLDVIARDHPDLWVKTLGYGLHSENGRITGLRK